MNEGPVTDGEGWGDLIDVIVPNYLEIPIAEPEFDTFRIRITMSCIMDGIRTGTNYQRAYDFAWIRDSIRNSDELLTFINAETSGILRLVATHLEYDPETAYKIQTLYFATGGDEDENWSAIRAIGAVDFTGRVPLPVPN